MIHWAPLSLEFLVRMAPLPSAGKWSNFAVFRKSVLPLHTLFTTIEVAGHIVVILEVFMKSLFTHRHLLHSLSLASISPSDTWLRTPTLSIVSFLCLPLTLPFGWQDFQLAWSPLRLRGVLGQLVWQMLQGISLQHHGT